MSRIKAIIRAAEIETEDFIAAIPAKNRINQANNKAIANVCKMMLLRKKPIYPSAESVAEEGRVQFPKFPDKQSLYNRYSKMLGIWRRAFEGMVDIRADPAGTSIEDFERLDLTGLDAGTRASIQEMKSLIQRLFNLNKNLKELIGNSVSLQPHNDIAVPELVEMLGRWLSFVRSSRFLLDDIGLRVSRDTIARTTIMDRHTFDRIERFVLSGGRELGDGTLDM
ncbi:hypothetical protein ATY75_32195 [Rhizobium sp. N122]|uniref:hypothetical protein n=1 Tax=Rhizobium sp. N122 TaxID=1764272 RepID=UPI000B5AB7BA|nr:hypothetical protein [Rhizobium sp. N122]OWV64611.1 hypothetical protein ATY75_32195 [Rhizobium sp. N122]